LGAGFSPTCRTQGCTRARARSKRSPDLRVIGSRVIGLKVREDPL